MTLAEVIVGLAGPSAILLGVGVSAWLVLQQMKLHYTVNRRNKALGYSLYANEHLRDARIKVEEAFGRLFEIREPIPMEKINETMESDPEVLPSIMTLLAHWENMALAIDSQIADDSVCYEMVASTLNQHVKIFRNFIEERRDNNKRIYHHLMELRRRWDARLSDVQVSDFQPPMVER